MTYHDLHEWDSEGEGAGEGGGGAARIGDVEETYTNARKWRVVEYGG